MSGQLHQGLPVSRMGRASWLGLGGNTSSGQVSFLLVPMANDRASLPGKVLPLSYLRVVSA